MIAHLLEFLKDESNRTVLQVIGSVLAALATAGWAVFTYFRPAKRADKNSMPSGPSVVIGQNVQAGHDVTINPTVTIGPDGKEINSKLDELKEQNSDLIALVEKLVAASPEQTAPGLKEAVTGAVGYADRGAQAGDARLKQALDLLKQNKVAEADALFGQVAAAAEQAGRRNFKEAASAYRHQGAIALLHEPWKAREAYAKAVQVDPNNVDGLAWDGWLQLQAKNLDGAEKSYRALLRVDGEGADEHLIFWARSGLGDILVARGKLPDALKAFDEARAAMERLLSLDAGNAEWRRDLSVSYNKIGDVLAKQRKLAKALKSYRAGLAIAEGLAASDAGNVEWQRDLSVSHEKIGEVLVSQDNLAEALKSYRVTFSIRERLTSSDARNAQWQRDLFVSDIKIGDVLVGQRTLAEALNSYRAGLAIAERFAASDAGNAEWQRDLSVSYNKIGDVLVSQRNLAEALNSYRAGLAIAERLAASDGGNVEWQRDLSISYDRVGDVLVKQGDLAETLRTYRASLAIRERLAASDAGDVQWRRDLSVSCSKLGDVYVKSKEYEKAREALIKGRAITAGLVVEHPDWAELKHDLAWFDAQLAALPDE